jgi:hypothetical protein
VARFSRLRLSLLAVRGLRLLVCLRWRCSLSAAAAAAALIQVTVMVAAVVVVLC